jgi:hypothetical protein
MIGRLAHTFGKNDIENCIGWPTSKNPEDGSILKGELVSISNFDGASPAFLTRMFFFDSNRTGESEKIS